MQKGAILLGALAIVAAHAIVAKHAGAQAAQEIATIPLGTFQTPFGTSVILGRTLLSPDEQNVAFVYLSHLRVANLKTKSVRELRSNFGELDYLSWTPDGMALRITRWKGGHTEVLQREDIAVDARAAGRSGARAGEASDYDERVFLRPVGAKVRNRFTYGFFLPDHREHMIAQGDYTGGAPWTDWSPDHKRLVTIYWESGVHHLLEVDAATGQSRVIAASSGMIDDFLWSWRDGLYFSHPVGDRRAELFLYPANGGPRRAIASAADGYNKVVGVLSDGTIVALRYRSPADFWGGLLDMMGRDKLPQEKQADLVLFKAPR